MSEDETPRDQRPIPGGYRCAIVTAITVILGFSFLFLRSWAFELPGEWTISGAIAAVLLLISILLQLAALWRSLQVRDELAGEYNVTLRWFLGAIVVLLISLVTAALSYSDVLKF